MVSAIIGATMEQSSEDCGKMASVTAMEFKPTSFTVSSMKATSAKVTGMARAFKSCKTRPSWVSLGMVTHMVVAFCEFRHLWRYITQEILCMASYKDRGFISFMG